MIKKLGITGRTRVMALAFLIFLTVNCSQIQAGQIIWKVNFDKPVVCAESAGDGSWGWGDGEGAG
jgi:hypothetical protein